MWEDRLRTQLKAIARRYQQQRTARRQARAWGLLAGVGVVLLITSLLTGWRSPWMAPVLAGAAILTGLVLRQQARRDPLDLVAVARQIEHEQPRLHALLLTACEQKPDPVSGELGYLQRRVIQEALEHNRHHPWGHRSFEQLFFARARRGAALLLLLSVLAVHYLMAPVGQSPLQPALPAVSVTPGDTDLERGTSLVVLARFAPPLPRAATLVAISAPGTETRVPLARNLDDPVFGGSLTNVTEDLTYRIEYGEQQTEAYRVTVFDYPRLERADAHLTYPAYTGLEPKTIEETRRVTAVEGTQLDYLLQLNKPVATAEWVGRDQTVLPLTPEPSLSNTFRLSLTLRRSGRFGLRLEDAAGRTNRLPAEFYVEVFTNRPPELKLLAPRGDERVSAVEEVTFRAEASDDFGLSSYGLAYQLGAGEPRLIESGSKVPRQEKRALTHLLALESLGARSGQLISYFLWADDVGPDGRVRRTFSDLYFLEVRPWDEIFRENQAGASDQEPQGGAPQGGPTQRLTELQKQILVATWKLQRATAGTNLPPPFVEDVNTARQSQEHALEQAGDLAERVAQPSLLPFVETATKEMQRAVERLGEASEQRSAMPLTPAIAAEQAAYEALLQLQGREYEVARSNSGRSSGSGRSGRSQRQLDQLRLRQAEDRYETQRQASAAQDPAQREQLQFLARLKELSQRQQDLNERLKELQAALQEARTEQEREEIRRQLKRLREEQQQMLADVDELQQRMERPEQQTRTAEARRQLEQTRSELQRAARSLSEGEVSQALAAGTRASRQLDQLREDFRQRNASQFAQDLRQMRQQARELVEREQDLARRIDEVTEQRRPSLSDAAPREELAGEMSRQTQALTNLMQQMRQVSERSEAGEPLLSRQLHEAFRQLDQADRANPREVMQQLLQRGELTRPVYELLREPDRPGPGLSLSTTERLLREGHLPAAQLLEAEARQDLAALQHGVNRAAESILGDEGEALRLARAELDELVNQLAREAARARSQATNQLAGAGDTNAPGALAANAPDRPPSDAAAAPRSSQASASNPQDAAGQDAQDPSGRDTTSPSRASSARPTGAAATDANAEGGRRAEPGGQRQGGQRRFYDLAGGANTDGAFTSGPLTGPSYREWSQRLGEVEELLELPGLRLEVARVRDRARLTRTEYQRHGKEPQWDLVQTELIGPLVEVRDQLIQELARRQSPDAIVPLDRDPVPPQYLELVRRYYEQLGQSQ